MIPQRLHPPSIRCRMVERTSLALIICREMEISLSLQDLV